jgi:CBS domain-containing protein
MLLNEICIPDVVYCSADSTALAAARLMRERHVGDVVVVDEPNGDQTPIGVVTDRDIVVEVIAKEQDPTRVTVREIMRTPVVVAHATEELSAAVERMKAHGVRRVPVMGESQRLVGILCLDDLLKQIAADAGALVEIVSREQNREHRQRR